MLLTAINFPSAIMPQSYRHYISIHIYIHHIVIFEDFADEATNTQLFCIFLDFVSCTSIVRIYLRIFTTFISTEATRFL